MAKIKLLEEDLYHPIKTLFENAGYTVKGEVKDCDITATKDDLVTIIEMKLNLNIELLTQAVKRQKISDSVYIAIPDAGKITFTKKWSDILHLLRRLELGLIIVKVAGDHKLAKVIIEPAPFDTAKSKSMNKKRRNSLLKEISGRSGDGNKGGSRGKKILTAYREAALQIACCMEKYGELSPSKLKQKGTNPEKTQSILSKNHYGWFEKIDRGIYKLSETGKNAIIQYNETSAFYRKLYDKD